MPIIQITLVEGRDGQAIERCIKEVAHTVSRTLGAPLNTVRVMVSELPPARFAVGDVLKSEPLGKESPGTESLGENSQAR